MIEHSFSPRQLECLYWIARGKTYEEIALILGISSRTVRTYLDSTRYKLNAVNLPQAVAIAITQKIIDPFGTPDVSVGGI